MVYLFTSIAALILALGLVTGSYHTAEGETALWSMLVMCGIAALAYRIDLLIHGRPARRRSRRVYR